MYENISALARQRLTGLSRGANRVYRVPALAAALSVALSPVQAKPIRIRTNGIMIGLNIQVQDALAASLAALEVRIQIAGTVDLFTDGESGVFMPAYMLCGAQGFWYPLDVPVEKGLDIFCTWQEITGGPATCVPSIAFNILETA